MALCKHCSIELTDSNWPKSLKNRKMYRCSPCNINYRKEHRRKLKRKAVAYLGGKCEHCDGVFHQAAFDFHHVNEAEKLTEITTLIGNRGWKQVENELQKCILLCSNCHRIHHYGE